MLTPSHSLPNLHAASRPHELSENENTPEKKCNSANPGIFAYNTSAAMLCKVDDASHRLAQDAPCSLNGSTLELLSLALVKNMDWPVDVPLAWKHDADTRPYTAFVPGEGKCWVDVAMLSADQQKRSIEICHDGKDNYSASKSGEVWAASGEDAFFKTMLAVRGDVSVDAISDKQAAEFRQQLANHALEQRTVLAALWQEGLQEPVKLEGADAVTAATNIKNPVNAVPINLERNPRWINPETRPACKYSPVKIGDLPHKDAIKSTRDDAMKSMQAVLDKRIDTCRELAMDRAIPSAGSWFSFVRGPQLHEPHLNKGTVPALVISGGSANKLRADLSKDYSLAWHPKNMTNERGTHAEPVYLLVHKLDYPTYASTMKELLEQYPNLHLVGWDGGKLTGFGAARASALAFADSLSYRPERVMMIDQDVVKTEQTRHTNPRVRAAVEGLHQTSHQPIAGYGIGYPARQSPPIPFGETLPPTPADLNGPAEQFVSIKAPFRKQWEDGIYPPYMVAGGEDMLMSKELGLSKDGRNTVLPEERIIKKELQGPADTPNVYWNEGRTQTLKALFEAEKNTWVEFEEQKMSLDDLLHKFKDNGWIASHPSVESYNVSACVIERIILRLNNELTKDAQQK
ncbi:hypothetical protein C4K26_4163 [Pseudomonas chlororaphis]|uniref:hypothetical protein n=1 Tax=Pseudomonas chlororaphis TaxID=587753 RepID=UPI000F56CF9A|nr:hypothetical protein [Pseudomonas chlororaphis]AZD09557.1 hypothetical protein C4K26_4163 [Pseudomonas chlororaphis]